MRAKAEQPWKAPKKNIWLKPSNKQTGNYSLDDSLGQIDLVGVVVASELAEVDGNLCWVRPWLACQLAPRLPILSKPPFVIVLRFQKRAHPGCNLLQGRFYPLPADRTFLCHVLLKLFELHANLAKHLAFVVVERADAYLCKRDKVPGIAADWRSLLTGRAAFPELGPGEVGALQFGQGKVGALQPGAGEVGALQVGPAEVGALQPGPVGRRPAAWPC